jgi:hypothetical protein
VLMRGAGDDASVIFDEFHTWVNASSMLAKCLVGRLAIPRPILDDQWPVDDTWTHCVMSERSSVKDSPTCWRVSLAHKEGKPLPPAGDPRSHLFLPYHIKIKISIGTGSKRKVIERPYTPLTHPVDLANCGISGDAETKDHRLHLVVKVYQDGLMSRLLSDKFQEGARVDVQLRPSRLVFPSVGVVRDVGRIPALHLDGVKEIGMIAAGTGIAPMLQVSVISKLTKNDVCQQPKKNLSKRLWRRSGAVAVASLTIAMSLRVENLCRELHDKSLLNNILTVSCCIDMFWLWICAGDTSCLQPCK